ncbi:thioredoxin-related transmembrane protein 1 [Euwallacea fornicatus]|uniref:thioredoxin-related transmembrane protein 1 n=1 Tax=Euwallacea fornicatus TaxID=995702 RepID=UPI00338FB372
MALRLTIFLIFAALIGVQAHKVIEIDEDNWTQILKGEWMVEFFAPWCPACKALEPRWKEFSRSGPALGIKIGAVDVTFSPGLSGRFMVTALPTIFHVINGEFRQYKGGRDTDSFSLFIEERKWEQVEPVPGWKAPDSIQMGVLSSFFKLSQTLRQIHNKFTNEYGLPTMVSYLIFAFGTIVLGAFLGLFLVCLIDFIFPPKQPASTKGSGDQKDKDSDNELNDEDIKDDLVDQEQDKEGDSEGDHASTESEGSQKEDNPRKRKANMLDM